MIVVISDGLDRGSKASFEQIPAALQKDDITVYAVQATDRTRGAIRRNVPKPKQVIDKLVEGTGGSIFSIDASSTAAKTICDELRKPLHCFLCSFEAPFGETRSLLVLGDEGLTVSQDCATTELTVKSEE